ncbi:hypothetical protein Tco_1573974 [Tanacetum coccineum]
MDIILSKELLMEIQSNAYHGKFDEDVVDHVAKVLEILDLIKIPNVDTYKLRVKVFPLSLAGDAKQWWIDEWNGKITAWGILVGRFFCKYFPLSRHGKNYVTNYNNADEPGYYELMAWLDSRWGNNESSDDIISSDDESEEYEYGNPPDTTTDSFFKPYMKTQEKNNIKREDERGKTKRKYNNTSNSNDEQANKRVKAEKFEAIKYSLRPNE